MLASYPLKNGSSPVLATDSGAPSCSRLERILAADSGAPSCWARIGAAAATSSLAAEGAASPPPPRTRNSPRRCIRILGRRPEQRRLVVGVSPSSFEFCKIVGVI